MRSRTSIVHAAPPPEPPATTPAMKTPRAKQEPAAAPEPEMKE
jgi:hypothetical protein